MSRLCITPTEALLQVAKDYPFKVAVTGGGDEWSYAALWARVRHIADKINDMDDDSRNPIGLYMGLEIDYVAAAHAIWLSGRTVVFLSSKWTPEVLQVVLERANVHLVLFGYSEPPAISGVRAVSTFSLVESQHSPNLVVPPPSLEVVEVVPLICSITPTSGSTGIPKSIVYPMRRSLEVLSEESSTLLQPMDGQWLRGGTTFLRPLFEIRRFMFNLTTLYLDPSTSIADQCVALCEELESTHNSQLLRVHFTPSVFRAFADFAQMRFNESQMPSGFNRIYWMVIGGESLSVRDLELARSIFPRATIACNYACSEVGFAGVSQMFVRPSDPIPSVISFGATQGCRDLVLLDESLSVIPKTLDGATGIVAFITSQSATHYLANEDASCHMFRPWDGDDMLLYTDDIGCMQPDGTIAIRGRSLRNVKVNGLFVDLDYVERALGPAFADKSLNVTSFKLVKSCVTDKIILFASPDVTDALSILKHARNGLSTSHNDSLAMVISAVRCIPEMPFNASYKIDLTALQKMADSIEFLTPDLPTEAVVLPTSKVDALAEEIAAEIAKLSKSSTAISTDMPLLYSGLNSITIVRLFMWLQAEYEYVDEMAHLFEEHITPFVLANEILGEDIGTMASDDAHVLTENIVAQIAKLAKSAEPIPKDIALLYSGLNSITMVRLYMWLQAEHAYEEEMTHLFDECVTAEVLAMEILERGNDGETQVEDALTEAGSDTVVSEGVPESKDRVLGKGSDRERELISTVAVSKCDVKSSDEPIRERFSEDGETHMRDPVDDDPVYQFVVVDESDSDSDSDHDPVVLSHRRQSSRFAIVDAGSSDSDDSDSDHERIVSRRQPKMPRSPLSADLKSPLRGAFAFAYDNDDAGDDVLPVSPLLVSSEDTPFSVVFSSWIMPVRDQVLRRPSLDARLAGTLD